jgi:serine/threonine-protein phosphatase 2A regulatory subunit B
LNIEKKYESCRKLLQRGELTLPRSKIVNESHEGRCKTLFKNAHEHHINSLSLNVDGENFLSADDLRINIWNIENNKEVFNVLDTKPKSISDLDAVITFAEFHPTIPSLFLYTTSKGLLNICDFRDKSSFQSGSSLQFEVGKGQKKNAFSELINSLSSGKFLGRGKSNVVATRDYLGVKLWDIRGTNQTQYMSC